MSDVFISYSREDLDKVSQIAAAVAEQGYDLWWDKDLPPHLSYTEVIQEKIGSAKAVIVVWSETASRSEWVRAEADMARNQNKLVQTSIDDGMPPLPFNQIQFASLSDWSGEDDHRDWGKVLQSLSDLVGRETPPPPKPSPKPAAEKPATAPPPAPMPAEPSGSGHSQLPLVISLITLAVVVGAVGWLFLGREAATPAAQEPPAGQLAENTADISEDAEEADSNPPTTAEPQPGPANSGEFNETAVIEDEDGWTNFRAGPSRSSTILGRIETGELFYTHRQRGSWWKIRTDDGEVGYMHYSRIALTSTLARQPKVYFPDSASRIITAEEMSRLTKSELRLARNEIFARRGRIFESPDLREHFSRFDWYQPVSAEVEINDIEKANAEAMQAAEQQR